MAALLGLTGAAIAQYSLPNITLEGTTTPVNAGTKKKPKNGAIRFNYSMNRESRVTTDQIVLFAPQHVRLSGKGFRYCPRTQIATNGVASCPRGSRVGSGTAAAFLGSAQLNFAVTVFWASKNELTFYLEQQGGQLKVPLSAPINDGGAPYGQKITVDIPPELQQPVRGAYASITGLNLRISGTSTRRVRVGGRRVTRRYRAVSVVGCPGDRTHDYLVRLRFVSNPNPPQQQTAQQGDTSACRK